jgi:hypothetical protein
MELHSVIHPIKSIQTMAQKTKEVVVFQVYILLMAALFGVLNEKHPLAIYEPSTATVLGESNDEPLHANPLDNLKPTYINSTTELDQRTT